MDLTLLIKGLIMGFSIAAPVGPIAVLCIQRTINFGRASGLSTGFGAATADGLYGALAAFGVAAISHFLVGQQFWFRLIGGTFLLYLGLRTLLSKPADNAPMENHQGLLFDYFSTVLLTLANPATILSFAGVFAGLGLAGPNARVPSAALMVVGVVCGSALWWLILTTGVSLLRRRFSTAAIAVVNRTSGSVILVLAAVAFASTIKK